MSSYRRLVPPCLALALALSASGCGTYMVAKTVTGAGSMVVGGAVGAVKLTGKAVGKTAGAVAGIGRDESAEYE
ncbi:hypothetical protein IMCC20628_01540 [Hoeflea sp. IMCC20628]|uniref:hypothetical protein n=1 Tax=Hoeflea sp. IMCC20628 TaxID=1620421 RepID=UPI00063A946F|nr:hypothetical protein [Hoeflea sp. IMCC20628]AKI00256.1 hypothetical protein IMCC20628_01540 [Hoeflea sp. IMCC20628]